MFGALLASCLLTFDKLDCHSFMQATDTNVAPEMESGEVKAGGIEKKKFKALQIFLILNMLWPPPRLWFYAPSYPPSLRAQPCVHTVSVLTERCSGVDRSRELPSGPRLCAPHHL